MFGSPVGRADATSLRRGLAVLFALEDVQQGDGAGLGVTQLATTLGYDKSQVSRTLRVLHEHGLVDRDAGTKAYRLGPRILSMAGRSSLAALLTAADPLLKGLARGLGERTHLSVLQGSEVLTLLSESPQRAVEATGWVGMTVPIHCTSSGRALLFDHGRDELDSLVTNADLRRLGPNAPTTVDELHRRLVVARGRGFALVDEEFEEGLVAAAAPVRDLRSRVVAAVNVSAPKFRFGDRIEAACPEIKRTADLLSQHLGWPGEDGR